MNYYIKIFVIAILFSIMDLIWIFWNRDFYLNTIKNIQGSDIEIKSYAIIFITYAIMILGLILICLEFVSTNIQKFPNVNRNLIAILSGAFYGFIINSIYNLTSYISYKNYTLNVAITDIIWAMILYASMSIIYINI